MATKRAKLTGVEQLFAGSLVSDEPEASPASAPPAPAPQRPQRWEDRFHRRTFYCADELWEALEQWCQQTGTSHSAALNTALRDFLAQQEPRKP